MATMVLEAFEDVQVNYGNLEDVFAIEVCTKLVENEQIGSAANADFERRLADVWCGSNSCRLEDGCTENFCFVGCDGIEGAASFNDSELECDGAFAVGNGEHPQKIGNQGGVRDSCDGFDGVMEVLFFFWTLCIIPVFFCFVVTNSRHFADVIGGHKPV